MAGVVRDELVGQGGGGAGFDQGLQVVEGERQADRRRDLEVGGVRDLAADRAVGDVGVDAVEEVGQRRQGGAGGGVVGFVEAGREGDQGAADKVYAGMTPLSADDVAMLVEQVLRLPAHININTLEVMPVQQAFSPFAVSREV